MRHISAHCLAKKGESSLQTAQATESYVLINTQGFCTWKKQLGLWHTTHFFREHLVYFYSLSLGLYKGFAMNLEI